MCVLPLNFKLIVYNTLSYQKKTQYASDILAMLWYLRAEPLINQNVDGTHYCYVSISNPSNYKIFSSNKMSI